MEIRYNIDLTDRNTFGMRVKAACVVEYDSIGDLETIRGMLSPDADMSGPVPGSDDPEAQERPDRKLPAPVLHIGGGSNLLFTKDFPGTLLHSRIKFIRAEDDVTANAEAVHQESDPRRGHCPAGQEQAMGDREILVEVGAGTTFDDFCAWAAERGLWGVENLSHIPGETGAAAVQNIGAYGAEIKDVIDKVHCYDMVLGRTVSFTAGECGYGYRDSLFKRDRKGRYIVTSVTFRLSAEPEPVLGYGHIRSAVESALRRHSSPAGKHCKPDARTGQAEHSIYDEAFPGLTPAIIRETITEIRKEKLPEPDETGSAGSFFKNPVVPKSDYDRVASIAALYLGEGCTVPHYDAGSGFVKIPAAWLIEQCGWKGYREGNVGVYDRQPLVIINATGKAAPDEVISLEEKIVSSVRDRFGITLAPEVEHI